MPSPEHPMGGQVTGEEASPSRPAGGLAEALRTPASELRAGASPAARPTRGTGVERGTPGSKRLGESLLQHESLVRRIKESAEEWEQKMQARRPPRTPLAGFTESYCSDTPDATVRADESDSSESELLQLKDQLSAANQQNERVQAQYSDLLSKMASVEVEARAAVARLAQVEAELQQREEDVRESRAEVAELTDLCKRHQMQTQVQAGLVQKREEANQELQRQKQQLMVARLQEMQVELEHVRSELAETEAERARAIDELRRRTSRAFGAPADDSETHLRALREDYQRQLSVLRTQLEERRSISPATSAPRGTQLRDPEPEPDGQPRGRNLQLQMDLEAEVARLRAANEETKLQLKRRDDILARQQASLDHARADIDEIEKRTQGTDCHDRQFYKCISDVVVTTALETSTDVVIAGKCFAGETVEALETRTTADGRVRVRISTGWLSVVASNGKVLLEDSTTDVLRTRIAEMDVVLRQRERDAEESRVLLADSDANSARLSRELQAAKSTKLNESTGTHQEVVELRRAIEHVRAREKAAAQELVQLRAENEQLMAEYADVRDQKEELNRLAEVQKLSQQLLERSHQLSAVHISQSDMNSLQSADTARGQELTDTKQQFMEERIRRRHVEKLRAKEEKIRARMELDLAKAHEDLANKDDELKIRNTELISLRAVNRHLKNKHSRYLAGGTGLVLPRTAVVDALRRPPVPPTRSSE